MSGEDMNGGLSSSIGQVAVARTAWCLGCIRGSDWDHSVLNDAIRGSWGCECVCVGQMGWIGFSAEGSYLELLRACSSEGKYVKSNDRKMGAHLTLPLGLAACRWRVLKMCLTISSCQRTRMWIMRSVELPRSFLEWCGFGRSKAEGVWFPSLRKCCFYQWMFRSLLASRVSAAGRLGLVIWKILT